MTDVASALKERQSVRRFKADPVPEELLRARSLRGRAVKRRAASGERADGCMAIGRLSWGGGAT
jgi:hypothetical protein